MSFCGARRFAFNWVVGLVKENLEIRRQERAAGVPEAELTPAVSWSARNLSTRWNSVKGEVAPWWREVSMHAFRSGIVDAATALESWSKSKTGNRKGRPVAFPKFKRRGKSIPSVSFVEINHQLSWLHPDVTTFDSCSPSQPRIRTSAGGGGSWSGCTPQSRPGGCTGS